MRVTLLTIGSRGDVQPMVALGLGLKRAGHDVRLATHTRFEAAATRHGLAFAPLIEGGVSRGAATAEGRRWIEQGSGRLPTWVGLLRDARSVADRRLRDAAAACDGADAIVAANLAHVLGWQMARELGVPLVRAFVEPPAWMLTRRSGRRVAPVVRQALWLAGRPWLNGVRRRALGLGPLPLRDPVADLDRQGAPSLYAFSEAVLPKPARLPGSVEITGYWFLEDGADPEPPAALREFLAAGPPPVCVTFSTMIQGEGPAAGELALEALRRAGRRGILLGAGASAPDDALPHELLALEAVSHAWLFPRCAAVVHHAAAGTTAAALRAGIASVAVPHMTDQFLWARRLHELGAAPAPLPRRSLSSERLGAAIRIASTDAAMHDRTAALAQRIRAEDGVARAVEAFDRHVGPRRTEPRAAGRRPVIPTPH
jgi:sterol 3beta-glucosyltransferase